MVSWNFIMKTLGYYRSFDELNIVVLQGMGTELRHSAT